MKDEACPTCGLYIFPLWCHTLIPALNQFFQLISHVLIQVKTARNAPFQDKIGQVSRRRLDWLSYAHLHLHF